MYSSRTALYINVILIIGLYTINAALVPNTNNKHGKYNMFFIYFSFES